MQGAHKVFWESVGPLSKHAAPHMSDAQTKEQRLGMHMKSVGPTSLCFKALLHLKGVPINGQSTINGGVCLRV